MAPGKVSRNRPASRGNSRSWNGLPTQSSWIYLPGDSLSGNSGIFPYDYVLLARTRKRPPLLPMLARLIHRRMQTSGTSIVIALNSPGFFKNQKMLISCILYYIDEIVNYNILFNYDDCTSTIYRQPNNFSCVRKLIWGSELWVGQTRYLVFYWKQK